MTGALDIGPAEFFGTAARFAGLDAYLLISDAHISFVGLSAGVFLGLILVPLSAVMAGVGVAVGNLKN